MGNSETRVFTWGVFNQMHAWFLEIAFVREVSMHVCVWMCVCVCVCVCVCPPLRL